MFVDVFVVDDFYVDFVFEVFFGFCEYFFGYVFDEFWVGEYFLDDGVFVYSF